MGVRSCRHAMPHFRTAHPLLCCLLHLFLLLCCSLDVSSHGLRNAGCFSVCDAMTHGSLRYVCLQRNHIQRKGAIALARCVLGLAHPTSRPPPPSVDPSWPVVIVDVAHNAIDARGVTIMQVAVDHATARRDEQQEQGERTTRNRADKHPGGSSQVTPSDDSPLGVPPESSSPVSPSSPSFFRSDLPLGGSPWSAPTLRPPAFSSRIAPHLARMLQASGCERAHKYAVQILCQHQQSTARDQPDAQTAALQTATDRDPAACTTQETINKNRR